MLFLTRVRPCGELALLRTYVPPVLPDGLFSNQKIPIWVNILEGLSLENVYIYICYGHLEYFTAIWDIGDHLVHFVFIRNIFSGFDIVYQEKSGNPVYRTFISREVRRGKQRLSP
jgi:hypothetical protein